MPNVYGRHPPIPHHHFSPSSNLSIRGENILNRVNTNPQQQQQVAMESNLRYNTLQLKDEKDTTTPQQQQQRDHDQVKDDPKPSSVEENLENIIHLKRALVKSCQNDVPGDYEKLT